MNAAERATDPKDIAAWLRFVIVGAGATGLELAGAIAEIARETLKHDFRKIQPQEAEIILMDGGSRVLSTYPEDLSAKAERLVSKLGVTIVKNALVDDIDAEGVRYKQGKEEKHMAARTVLWAGGVRVNAFGRKVAERLHAQTDRSGKIHVQPDLTVAGFPDVYIVGDLAELNGQDGKPLPGVAQVAIQEGRYAGKAIRSRLEGQRDIAPFRYFNKGDMAVIGRAAAVANIFGFHVSGVIAWFIWLFIHLMYIVEFQSRVMVFVQWGFEYLTFSRGARLITGGETVDAPLQKAPIIPGEIK